MMCMNLWITYDEETIELNWVQSCGHTVMKIGVRFVPCCMFRNVTMSPHVMVDMRAAGFVYNKNKFL